MDEVSSYVRLNLPSHWRQGRPKDCSTSSSNPMMEGPLVPSPKRSESPWATSTLELVDSLKALDPRRPIREADMAARFVSASAEDDLDCPWNGQKWLRPRSGLLVYWTV